MFLDQLIATLTDKVDVIVFVDDQIRMPDGYIQRSLGNHWAARWARALSNFPKKFFKIKSYELVEDQGRLCYRVYLDSEYNGATHRLETSSNCRYSDLDFDLEFEEVIA